MLIGQPEKPTEYLGVVATLWTVSFIARHRLPQQPRASSVAAEMSSLALIR